MTKIIDLSGKGAAISGIENDANLSSLSGINSDITATTHTIDVDDQNDTIEYSNASAIAVTLPTIASVSGSNIHTDDFKVTLKNIGAGLVTVTRGGPDTFDDGSTSIAINQYECVTIQTDNSLTKWNIINEYLEDASTKTGTETLTNKTLASPSISDAAFSGTQTGFAGNVTGALTGNADTATAWLNARSLSFSGDVSGTSVAFDGSTTITTINLQIGADKVGATELNTSGLTRASAVVGAASSWTVPEGLYNVISIADGIVLEIKDAGGTWRSSFDAFTGGLLLGDNANVRLFNTIGASITIYYANLP